MTNEIQKYESESALISPAKNALFFTPDMDEAEIFAALSADTPLSENLKKPFGLVGIVAKPVELVSAEGELINAVRVSLVASDGAIYTTVSEQVRQSIGQIIAVFGAPSKKAPVTVQAVEIKTRRGFKMLKLIPA